MTNIFQVSQQLKFAQNNLATASVELEHILNHGRADMEDINEAKAILAEICTAKKEVRLKIERIEEIENLIATAKGR